MHHKEILARYPLVSDQVNKQELAVILGEFEKVLTAGTRGDVVEFGCYRGTTSLFLRRLLDANSSEKVLHVYDSFEGLPPKSRQDQSVAGDQFAAGELAVSKKDLLLEFKKANLRPPIVHKGWFSQLTGADVPEQVCFAYLDGDFYDSIIDSLKLVWPRLASGGIVCIDDYGRDALPGVERAVGHFFAGQNVRVAHQYTQAVVVKP